MLTDMQKQILRLIKRSDKDADGWHIVSKTVLPLIERASLGELVDLEKSEQGARLRLTERAEVAERERDAVSARLEKALVDGAKRREERDEALAALQRSADAGTGSSEANASRGRKIIHIAVEPQSKNQPSALYALCDDGMIFVTTFDPQIGWTEWCAIEPIPKDVAKGKPPISP